MTRIILPVTLGLLLAAASLCTAQTDADDVKATMEGLLASAKAADADTAAEYAHELIVTCMDMDEGVKDHDAFIDGIKTDPPPAELSFDEYEPEIYGDIACVVAPLNFPAGDAPPIEVSLGAILLRTDGEWKVLAMCMLAPDIMDVVPADQKAGFQAMVDALATFAGEIGAAGRSEEPGALLKLCRPDGVVATPHGEDGGIVAARVSDVLEMIDHIPAATTIPTDDPNQVGILGLGAALLAVNATIKVGDAEPRLGRHTAIAAFDPNAGGWKILALVEGSIEE